MAKRSRRKFNTTPSRFNDFERDSYHVKESDIPKRSWTYHDLTSVRPLTPTQEDMFTCFFNEKHICAYGSAGTGKSFLSIFLAMNEILSKKEQSHLIIVRSAVTTRDIGFLPGTEDEKMAHFENPYRDILAELFGRASTYDDMKQRGLIKFLSTSHIRGVTWDNAIVLVDECQNMTFHEIDSVITRIGENSKIILAGDIVQTDLTKRSSDKTCMGDLLKVLKNVPDFECLQFTKHDIVRSKFVKSWIEACEDANVYQTFSHIT